MHSLFRLTGSVAALLLTSLAIAQSPLAPAESPPHPASAVPASRAAKNVVVITIRGPIDEWTLRGVTRRMADAVRAGADAIVFELDTPGGLGMATMAICNAIKACPIQNTVAWINPDAYSAGSVIALACREIVVSPYATMGDSLPIRLNARGEIDPMPDAEREKVLGPLIAEVVDSARRNGHDEMLVQGIVRRGVELWLIEHQTTGKRFFVTEDQYRAAVGAEPERKDLQIQSATGPLGGSGSGIRGKAKPSPSGAETPPDSAAPPADAVPSDPGAEAAPTDDEPNFESAAPKISKELRTSVSTELELRGARKSDRPDFNAPDHAGQYRPLEYVTDGHGLVVLKTDQMIRYEIAAERIASDEELKAFFGATDLRRLDQTWSESLVRFMSHPAVKVLLLVLFLVAFFVEMAHPGVGVPALVAAAALIGLVVPPLLIDLAAWWMVAAIVAGIALLALEVLVLPGFGIFGVLGVALLLGGLVGAFVGPAALFPDSPQEKQDLTRGVISVLLSLITSGALIWALARHLPSLPIFNRLVLKDTRNDDADSMIGAMAEPVAALIQIGDVGRALTPLRPSGRAQFGEEIVDVSSEFGFVHAGEEVRVTSMDSFRVGVSPIKV